MRYILLAFFTIFLLLGCGQGLIQQSESNDYFTEQYSVRKKDNVKHGPYKKYTLDGGLVEEGEYVDGAIEGERKKFENGRLFAIETIADGKFHGLYQSFYPDGSLNSVGNYENDEMVGVWKRYYRNGQLMEEVSFEGNLENGPFKEYYENGSIKAEGQYLDGDQEHGELRLYNEKGVLIRKMNCDRGICKTTWELEKD